MIDQDTRDRIMAAPEALLKDAGVMNALIGAGGRWGRTSSICAGWRWSGRSAAAIRTANHITQCALLGTDGVAAPPAVIKAMISHPLTDMGRERFTKDWAKTGQKIL